MELNNLLCLQRYKYNNPMFVPHSGRSTQMSDSSNFFNFLVVDVISIFYM